MVRANHLDTSPPSRNELTSRIDGNGCSSEGGLVPGRTHQHTRNTSSSASSTASTNPIADWGSVSTAVSLSSASSVTSSASCSVDSADKRRWTTEKPDLIQSNLSEPNHSSSEDYYYDDDDEDEERIKLICGDPDTEDWADHTSDDAPSKGAGAGTGPVAVACTRRRRIFPKLAKVLHKVRRKLNWQLVLFLALILIVFLSMTQINEYQYKSSTCPRRLVASCDPQRHC